MKIKGDFRTYPEWVYQELMNWSRWCWLGALPQPTEPETCASFEKNYRHTGEEEGKQEARPAPPNRERAESVQAVWETLAEVPQQVLRAEYPQRIESGRVSHGRIAAARWLRRRGIEVNLDGYEAALSAGVCKVMAALEGEI